MLFFWSLISSCRAFLIASDLTFLLCSSANVEGVDSCASFAAPTGLIPAAELERFVKDIFIARSHSEDTLLKDVNASCKREFLHIDSSTIISTSLRLSSRFSHIIVV